jgi:hypothetical protein
MCRPVRFDWSRGVRGYERSIKRACEDGRRKDSRQGLGEAREGLSVPFCLLGLPIRPAAAPSHLHSGARGKTFVHSPFDTVRKKSIYEQFTLFVKGLIYEQSCAPDFDLLVPAHESLHFLQGNGAIVVGIHCLEARAPPETPPMRVSRHR